MSADETPERRLRRLLTELKASQELERLANRRREAAHAELLRRVAEVHETIVVPSLRAFAAELEAQGHPTRIDRRGLHKTNVWLLRRCITTLAVEPDYVLTDGFPVKRLGIPNLSIKKGDAVTASVAAASIVAKVTRDKMMDRYHRRFPVYGFDHNRGYGTAEHREAIRRLGPTPIHRYSFKGLATGYYDAPGADRVAETAGDA